MGISDCLQKGIPVAKDWQRPTLLLHRREQIFDLLDVLALNIVMLFGGAFVSLLLQRFQFNKLHLVLHYDVILLL